MDGWMGLTAKEGLKPKSVEWGILVVIVCVWSVVQKFAERCGRRRHCREVFGRRAKVLRVPSLLGGKLPLLQFNIIKFSI